MQKFETRDRYHGLFSHFTESNASRLNITADFKRQSAADTCVTLHNPSHYPSHYQTFLINAFVAVRVSAIHFPRPMPRVIQSVEYR